MSRFSVCHLVESLEPWGTQRILVVVARHAAARGHRTIVIALRDGPLGDELRAAGVDVSILRGGGLAWAAAWRARKVVAAAAAEAVHLWDDWALRRVGPLLPKSRGPLVVALRKPARRLPLLASMIERRMLRRATRIIANDPWVLEQRLANCSAGKLLSVGNSEVVRDAIDAGRFTKPMSREAALQSLGLTPDAVIVGTASRVTSNQNIRDLILAGALLRQLQPKLRLVICGDGPALENLRRFTESLQMGDLTQFVGPIPEPADVLPHFHAYFDGAAFAGPSLALVEAQWSGVPVVCVDTPVRRRLVGEHSAIFYREHDIAALSRELLRLLENHNHRSRFAVAGKQFAAACNDPEAMLQRYGLIV